jgi:leader peptidase (prepilin peptidase)/N-methyltransferase
VITPALYATVASVAFGLIIGSFVNVVVARVPHGHSIVRPGSSCPSCQAPIRWYDNLPVLSFVLLGAKCRHCRAPISARYPIIEALTAILFVAATYRSGWGWHLFVRDWPLMAALVAVTFIDLEHRIIPDVISLPGIVLGLATTGLDERMTWPLAFAGAAIGFGVFYLFAWLYERSTGRAGLGGGDVKLLAMLGAFLGPLGAFCAIFISSIFGSVVGIGWALATRKQSIMKVAIPYGPFLVVGGLYYYLFGEFLWFQYMIPT